MKRTILLTAITIITVMAANTVSAQYHNEGNNGYRRDDRGYNNSYNNGYGNYQGNDMRRHERREFHERRDIMRDRRRIEELQYAMQADRYNGNWDAYRYHESQLRDLYNDIARDRDRMYRHDDDDRRGFGHY